MKGKIRANASHFDNSQREKNRAHSSHILPNAIDAILNTCEEIVHPQTGNWACKNLSTLTNDGKQ